MDTARVAVGGHSYGAFMAANLLVSPHSSMQCSWKLLSWRLGSILVHRRSSTTLSGLLKWYHYLVSTSSWSSQSQCET